MPFHQPTSKSPPSRTAPPRRAVIAFALAAAGLIAARQLPGVPSTVWFSLAAGAAAIGAASAGRRCRAALSAAMLALAAGWLAFRVHERPPGPLWEIAESTAARPEETQTVLSVEGLILDDPRAAPAQGAMAQFAARQPFGLTTLRVWRVRTQNGWQDTPGSLRVRVKGSRWSAEEGLAGFGLAAGDPVRISGLFRPTDPPANPGDPDLAQSARQRGVAGTLTVERAELIEPIEPPSLWDSLRAGAARRLAQIRRSALRTLDPGPSPTTNPDSHTADERARALILSLFLGVNDAGDPELRQTFTRVGLAHALAISGFHVTVVLMLALFAIRLTGDRGRLESVFVTSLALAYLALVPAEAPVVRAVVMVVAVMLARAFGKSYDRVNVIAWVGVALLAWRPLDLWSLGFQLSLGLTALLLWTGTAFHARLFGTPLRGLVRAGSREPLWVSVIAWLLGAFKRTLSASILGWAVSMPVLASTTGLFTPLAVVSTVIVLPMIVVLMWVGYAALAVGLVLTVFGIEVSHAASSVLLPLARAVTWSVDRLDHIPAMTLHTPPFTPWWAAGAVSVVLYWCVRGHPRDRRAWALTAVIAAWATAEWAAPSVGPARSRVRVDILAAGSGACTLVHSGPRAVLWNCGSSRADAGIVTLPRTLRSLGVWRIDTVVLAGGDLGAWSALADLAPQFGVRRVILSPAFARAAEDDPTGPAAWLTRRLKSMGLATEPARDGMVLSVGAATMTIYRTPVAHPNLIARTALRTDAADGPAMVLAGELVDTDAPPLAERRLDLRADAVELPRRTPSSLAAPSILAATGAPIAIAAERSDSVAQGIATVFDLRVAGAAWIELRPGAPVRAGSRRALDPTSAAAAPRRVP